MRTRALLIAGCAVTTIFVASGAAQDVAAPRPPVAVSSLKVTIEGASKKGPFFASTRTVRVTRVQLAEPRSAGVLQQALRPGGLEAFEVAIPVLTLTSPDKGVDAHIHSSLKADIHPEIRFQLRSITNGPDDPVGLVRLNANGTLTIAGVDREVALQVAVVRARGSLLVDGSTDVRMTDFGVTPPAGLLGMLTTDPVIHVRFYLIVTAADG